MKNNNDITCNKLFFQPLFDALASAPSKRECSTYSDQDFLKSGVERIIHAAPSGRAHVQYIIASGVPLSVRNFFANLSSKRRLNVLTEVSRKVCQHVNQYICANNDPLKHYPELKNFDIYASDGHQRKASAHEEKRVGKKRPTKDIFSLNVRTHSLSYLSLVEPDKNMKDKHEITTLKQLSAQKLSLGAPVGRRVIHIYDPAIINYMEWHRWKHRFGIYIITREKSSSQLITQFEIPWDSNDLRNSGVLSDEAVGMKNGYTFRRVTYQDPVEGKTYRFITTEMKIPPGLIASLYKSRWDIEKVFDEIKNKFGQKQSWGKTRISKQQQAEFITLAHNLTLLFEKYLEKEEGIRDEKVYRKQYERHKRAMAKAKKSGQEYMPFLTIPVRATQRSFQFIRWLRSHLIQKTSYNEAVKTLQPLMMAYLY